MLFSLCLPRPRSSAEILNLCPDISAFETTQKQTDQYVVFCAACKDTVLPAKSNSDVMFRSLSYQGLIIDRSPGCVVQSVTCLATDACLTADPGVASSIPARSHTFVKIDHEIISTVILLPSADSFKKDCCQLQAKVCAQITG